VVVIIFIFEKIKNKKIKKSLNLKKTTGVLLTRLLYSFQASTITLQRHCSFKVPLSTVQLPNSNILAILVAREDEIVMVSFLMCSLDSLHLFLLDVNTN